MREFFSGVWRLFVLTAAALLPAVMVLMPAKAWGEMGAAVRFADEPPQTTTTATATATTALPSGQPTAAEQAPLMPTATTVPPKKAGGGTVVEEVVAGGKKLADNLYYKNRDDLNVNFAAFLNKKPHTVLEKNGKPQVLILHTHTTETYMSYYAGYYNEGDLGRSTDTTKNVAVAGEALANALRARGIETVHDVTLHDDPEYVGAYYRSADTAEKIRKKYPSVKLVIDVHRDAIQRSDTVAVKPTVMAAGETYAQMMLVIGGENTADNPNPNRDENVAIALALQKTLLQKVPDVMRPISFCACEYNQSLCTGFLVEVGAQANTFEEAERSAALLGDAVATVLGK